MPFGARTNPAREYCFGQSFNLEERRWPSD